MAKDILKKEIIGIFHRSKLQWKPQTTRDNVSRFKIKNCSGCTQNATAYILGLTKDVKVWRKLDKVDKESLKPYNVPEIVSKYTHKNQKNSKGKSLSQPNFKIKIQNSQDPVEKSAYFNASLYSEIYILENKLRKLIFKELGNDLSWWKKEKVTQEIIDYANRIAEDDKKTPWIPRTDKHPLYLITLKHLSKIIELNWKGNFNKLGKVSSFLTYIDDLSKIRNCIAHNIPLGNRDKKEVQIQVPKILSLLKQNYSI